MGADIRKTNSGSDGAGTVRGYIPLDMDWMWIKLRRRALWKGALYASDAHCGTHTLEVRKVDYHGIVVMSMSFV